MIDAAYEKEISDKLVAGMKYPVSQSAIAAFSQPLLSDHPKYDRFGHVQRYPGITVIAHHPEKDYDLFRDLTARINEFNKRMGLKIIQTVPITSEHMTIYDLVSQGDVDGKYAQFNKETKDAVDALTAALQQQKGYTREQALEQACYEVVTDKVYKALKTLSAKRPPVFEPYAVLTFIPSSPGPIVLGMKPIS